jgi:hypothetical protein
MTAPNAESAELDLRESREEVDPELLELPDPPRKERRTTLALLALSGVLSAAMAFGLSRDASYALGGSSATGIGDLRSADAATFVPNSYVEGTGRLSGSGALRYERPFESESYRLMPVAGREDVWVEVRVPAGGESGRWIPPQEFSGRLVPFSKAGLRHRGLRGGVEDMTGQKVPANAWLLVDGQTPDDARCSALLAAMFAIFAAWNAVTLFRLTRKVK